MDKRINRKTVQEYLENGPRLEEAVRATVNRRNEAQPAFRLYPDRGYSIDCEVGEAGALRLHGCLKRAHVSEFIGWLRDVFPEEFKKAAKGSGG